MEDKDSTSRIAMSTQQKRYSADTKKGALQRYKELAVGDSSWGHLFSYELYNLLFCGLSGLVGFGLRKLYLPHLTASCGANPAIGKDVFLRQPKHIHIGKGVLIDDNVVLDARSSDKPNSTSGIYIGDHALIGRQSIITAKGGTIKLGAACNISSCCRVATQSSIEIGDSVLIAAYVYIGCGNHKIDDLSKPIIEQEMDIRSGVKIGKNAWIGTRATILDGVTIGEEAVIGAHSLVTEDVPPRAIVVGTPAKVIRYRTN